MSDARATIGIGIDVQDLSRLKDVTTALQNLITITSSMYKVNSGSSGSIRAVGTAASDAEGDIMSLARAAEMLDESMTEALKDADKSAVGAAKSLRALSKSLTSDAVKDSSRFLEDLFKEDIAGNFKSIGKKASKDFEGAVRDISRATGLASESVKDLFAMERMGMDPRAVGAFGRALAKEARNLDSLMADFKKTRAYAGIGAGQEISGRMIRDALLKEKKQKYKAEDLAGIPEVTALKQARGPLLVNFGANFDFSPEIMRNLQKELQGIGMTPFRGAQQKTVAAAQKRAEEAASASATQLTLDFERAAEKITEAASSTSSALVRATEAAEQLTLGLRATAQQLSLGFNVPTRAAPEPAETGRRRKKATTTQGAMPAQAEGPLVSPPPGAAAAAGAASEQLKWTEGWKLHLNAAKDPAVRAKINQALNEMKQAGEIQAFKEGMADPGKEFTVYVGELDKAVDIARKINHKFGSLLKTVTQADAQMETDVRIIGEIFARFDSHDLRFNRYGFQGIQALRSDMQMSSSPGQPHGRLISGLFGTPVSEETFKAARQDAYDTLAQMYGQAFTGSTNRFTIGAAGLELAIGGAAAPQQASAAEEPGTAVVRAGRRRDNGGPGSGTGPSFRRRPGGGGGGAGDGGGGAGGLGMPNQGPEGIPMDDVRLAQKYAEAIREIGRARLALPSDVLTANLQPATINLLSTIVTLQRELVDLTTSQIQRIRNVNASLADSIDLERTSLNQVIQNAAITNKQINAVRKAEGEAAAERLKALRATAKAELERINRVQKIINLEKAAEEAGKRIYGADYDALRTAIAEGESYPSAFSDLRSRRLKFRRTSSRPDVTTEQRLAAGYEAYIQRRTERLQQERQQRIEQSALQQRLRMPTATAGGLAQNLAVTDMSPLQRAQKIRDLMVSEQDESIRRVYAAELKSIEQNGREKISSLVKARAIHEEIGRLQQTINAQTSRAEKKRINDLIEGLRRVAEAEGLPLQQAAQMRARDAERLRSTESETRKAGIMARIALMRAERQSATSLASQLKKTDDAVKQVNTSLQKQSEHLSRLSKLAIKYNVPTNANAIMDAYYERFKGRMPSTDPGLTQRIEENERKLDAVFRAGFRLKMVGMDLQYAGRRVLDTLKMLSGGYEEFEFTLLRAAGSLGDWAVNTGDNTEQAAKNFDYLKESVIQASMTIKLFTAEEIGKALYFYASTTGQAVQSTEDLDNILRVLQPIMATAAMTNTGYEETIKGVYSIVSQFNPELVALSHGYGDVMSAQKGTELLTNRMIDVTQKLFYATQATAAEFPDLVNAFKMVGPVAAQAGASFEDMIDLVARLSDIGIKGTMSGRGLRQMFIQMARPSPAARKAYEQLFARVRGSEGLEEIDARGTTYGQLVFPGGEFKGTSQYINDLARALRLVTPEYKAFILARITTANELPILTALVNDEIRAYERGGQVFSKTADISVQAARRFELAFNALVNSGKAVFAGLDRTVEALRLTIGENVVEALKPFVQQIQDIILSVRTWMLDNSALVKDISAIAAVIGGLSVAIGSLSIGLGTLVGFGAAVKLVLSSFLPVFPSIVAGISLIVAIVSNAIKEFDSLQASFQALQDAIASGANDAQLNLSNVIDTVTELGSGFSDISKLVLALAKSVIDASASLVRFSKETEAVGSAVEAVVKMLTIFFGLKLTSDLLRAVGAVKLFEKTFIGTWKTVIADVDGTVDYMGKTYQRGEEVIVRQESLVKRMKDGFSSSTKGIGKLNVGLNVMTGLVRGLHSMFGTLGLASIFIGGGMALLEADFLGIKTFFSEITYSAEKAKDKVSELAKEFGALQFQMESTAYTLADALANSAPSKQQIEAGVKTWSETLTGIESAGFTATQITNPVTQEVSLIPFIDPGQVGKNLPEDLGFSKIFNDADRRLINEEINKAISAGEYLTKDGITLEIPANFDYQIQEIQAGRMTLTEESIAFFNSVFAGAKTDIVAAQAAASYLELFKKDFADFNKTIASFDKVVPEVSESTYFTIANKLVQEQKILDYNKVIEATNIILREAILSGGTVDYKEIQNLFAEKEIFLSQNQIGLLLKGTEFDASFARESVFALRTTALQNEKYYNGIAEQINSLRDQGLLTVEKLSSLILEPIKVDRKLTPGALWLETYSTIPPAIDIFGDPDIASAFPYWDDSLKFAFQFLGVTQAQFMADVQQFQATADALVVDSIEQIKVGVATVADKRQAEGVSVIADIIQALGAEYTSKNPNLQKIKALYLEAWNRIVTENVTEIGPLTYEALELIATALEKDGLLEGGPGLKELQARFGKAGEKTADDVASLMDSLRQGVESRVKELRSGRLGDIDSKIISALTSIVTPSTAAVPNIPGFMGVSAPTITDTLGALILDSIKLDNGMSLREAYLAGRDISQYVVDPALAEVVNVYLKGLVDEGVISRKPLPINKVQEDRTETVIANAIQSAVDLGIDYDVVKKLLEEGSQAPGDKADRITGLVKEYMGKSLLQRGLLEYGSVTTDISEINTFVERVASDSGKIIEYVSLKAFSKQRSDVTGIIDKIISTESSPNDAFVKIAYELASYIPPGYSSTLRELWNSGKDLAEVLGDEAIAGIVENYFTEAQARELYGFMGDQTDKLWDEAIQGVVDTWNSRKDAIEQIRSALKKPADRMRMRNLARTIFGGLFGEATRPGASSEAAKLAQDYLNGGVESINDFFANPEITDRRKRNVATKLAEFLSDVKIKNLSPKQREALFNILPSIESWADQLPGRVQRIVDSINFDKVDLFTPKDGGKKKPGPFTDWLEDEDPSKYKNAGIAAGTNALSAIQEFVNTLGETVRAISQDGSQVMVDSYNTGVSIGKAIINGVNDELAKVGMSLTFNAVRPGQVAPTPTNAVRPGAVPNNGRFITDFVRPSGQPVDPLSPEGIMMSGVQQAINNQSVVKEREAAARKRQEEEDAARIRRLIRDAARIGFLRKNGLPAVQPRPLGPMEDLAGMPGTSLSRNPILKTPAMERERLRKWREQVGGHRGRAYWEQKRGRLGDRELALEGGPTRTAWRRWAGLYPKQPKTDPYFKDMLEKARETGTKIPPIVLRAIAQSTDWAASGTSIGSSWGNGWAKGAAEGINTALLIIKATVVGNSPPKAGPLKTINKGGKNIGQAWGSAFSGAAVSSVKMGTEEVRRRLDEQNREFAHRGSMDVTMNRNDKKKIEISLNVTGDGSANRATMSELRRGLMDALVMADLEHMVEVI